MISKYELASVGSEYMIPALASLSQPDPHAAFASKLSGAVGTYLLTAWFDADSPRFPA